MTRKRRCQRRRQRQWQGRPDRGRYCRRFPLRRASPRLSTNQHDVSCAIGDNRSDSRTQTCVSPRGVSPCVGASVLGAHRTPVAREGACDRAAALVLRQNPVRHESRARAALRDHCCHGGFCLERNFDVGPTRSVQVRAPLHDAVSSTQTSSASKRDLDIRPSCARSSRDTGCTPVAAQSAFTTASTAPLKTPQRIVIPVGAARKHSVNCSTILLRAASASAALNTRWKSSTARSRTLSAGSRGGVRSRVASASSAAFSTSVSAKRAARRCRPRCRHRAVGPLDEPTNGRVATPTLHGAAIAALHGIARLFRRRLTRSQLSLFFVVRAPVNGR